MRRVIALGLTVLGLLLVGLVIAPARAAVACDPVPEPSLTQAVGNDGVVGVVERQVLATNPLPWGRSISVATRIWGGIQVERWKVGDRMFVECPTHPSFDVGFSQYDFRGSQAEWDGVRSEIYRPEPIPEDQEILLEAEFGPAQRLAVAGPDRFMANVRVWGLEITLVAAGLVSVSVSVLRRRRAKRHDRHLF